MIIISCPSEMMEIAGSYDKSANDDSLVLAHTLTKRELLIEM
jgi:hypothetical protein